MVCTGMNQKYSNKLKIDDKKGPGTDGIPPIFVRRCALTLALPLTLLFNKSIQEGVLPKKWKEASVFPVYKTGQKDVVENCRPISKINCFGKFFEKTGFQNSIFHSKACYTECSTWVLSWAIRKFKFNYVYPLYFALNG